ncbi:MAG: glycosyltransferase [Oscillochloris sp.]|nr:glycosyltransferase [Oscillochloris sp.]
MKIVHISTNDTGGGAARAAYRLHIGLRRLGHDSQMYVAQKQSDDPTVLAIPAANGLNSLRERGRGRQIRADFKPYKNLRPQGLEPFTDDRSRYGKAMVDALPPADIINLHWAAMFLDYGMFFRRVPARTPVVWRLSDMNAFTGGCHYDEGCGRYAAACGACPQLVSRDPNDLSFQIWQRKRAAYDAIPPGRLHIVALNQWIAGEVRRSSLLSTVPVHVIPNGLDTNTFAPRDRAFARSTLGVPADAKVVLFVAHSTKNRRKGLKLLVEALAGMDDIPNLFFLSIGRGGTIADLRIPQLSLGQLNQDRLISLVYSAADLFVIPSLQDNMPSTALEAVSCGTPVVGFDVGGVPEIVRPGVTGLLAPVGDVGALRAAIRQLLLDEPRRQAIAECCRTIALAEYTQELQARRYVELYEHILNDQRA